MTLEAILDLPGNNKISPFYCSTKKADTVAQTLGLVFLPQNDFKLQELI